MNKRYAIKFKEGIDEIKKSAILQLGVVVDFLNSFGIYVIELSQEIFFTLRKDVDLLYVKEST